MDFQLLRLIDEVNAQASLPNEPRNEQCATCHLPGLLEPATAQWKPKFLNLRIFGLSDLRGHFEITPKYESSVKMAKNRTAG